MMRASRYICAALLLYLAPIAVQAAITSAPLCNIAKGASTCKTTISWNASSANTSICVDGGLFMSGVQSGSQGTPDNGPGWITSTGSTFTQYDGLNCTGNVIDSAFVYGQLYPECGAGPLDCTNGGTMWTSNGPYGQPGYSWLCGTPRSPGTQGDGCAINCAQQVVNLGYNTYYNLYPNAASQCTAQNTTCGNGVVEGTETCDAGASNGQCGGVCNSTCSGYTSACSNSSGCGDGIAQPSLGEVCDDGLVSSGGHNGQCGYCNNTCSGETTGCGLPNSNGCANNTNEAGTSLTLANSSDVFIRANSGAAYKNTTSASGGNYCFSNYSGLNFFIPTKTTAEFQSFWTRLTGNLPYGLIGYWSFDDGSGSTALDTSGFGNNGTLVNSPVWVTGKLGKALQFNGSNNFVNLGAPATFSVLTKPLTITAWIYPLDGGPYFQPILGQYKTTSGSQLTKLLRLDNSVLTYITSNPNDGSYVYASGQTIPHNTWSFVAIVIDGSSTARFYLNGSLQTGLMATPPGYADQTVDTYIGGDICTFCANVERFNGSIDEVRLYNRALSDSEISSVMNYVKPPGVSGLAPIY